MSLSEIIYTALVDTALGMGTVFALLILISIVIWALGRTVGEANPKKMKQQTGSSIETNAAGNTAGGLTDNVGDTLGDTAVGSAEKSGAITGLQPSVNKDGLTPELVAVIATTAINMHLREQKDAAAANGYVVRNIRRSTPIR